MYFSHASYKAVCPTGMTGSSVTMGASAESIISQRDADVKATLLAESLAFEHLQCVNPTEPVAPVFLSDAVTAVANSQPGYVVQTFTVSYAPGAVYSLVSVAEATAQAQVQAQADADHARDTQQKLIWYNDEQSYNNSCADLLGGGYEPMTYSVTIAPGTFSSNTSKAAANLAAYNAAKSAVAVYLATNCLFIYYSAAVSYTATCGGGLVGDPVTVTYSPGAFTSTVSQSAADSTALSAATQGATAALVCGAGFWNSQQSAVATCIGAYGPGWLGSNASAVVSASTVHDTTSSAANSVALSMAKVSAVDNLRCEWGGGLLP